VPPQSGLSAHAATLLKLQRPKATIARTRNKKSPEKPGRFAA